MGGPHRFHRPRGKVGGNPTKGPFDCTACTCAGASHNDIAVLSAVAGEVDLGNDVIGSLIEIFEKFPDFDGTNPPTTEKLESAPPTEASEDKEGKDEL